MGQNSPALNQVMTQIQSAPNDKERHRIALDFVNNHTADVQALMPVSAWYDKRTSGIDGRAGLQPTDMASVLMGAAMLQKLGVTAPTSEQLINNGEIAYKNCCGCYTQKFEYQR